MTKGPGDEVAVGAMDVQMWELFWLTLYCLRDRQFLPDGNIL